MSPIEQVGIKMPGSAGEILKKPGMLGTEQPAPTEPARLTSDFTNTINLVGTVNEKMVDWNYTGPDKDAARKTEAADIVNQDGPLKGLPVEYPKVVAESKRRKTLITTFETIHTAVDSKQAAADEVVKTVEMDRQKLIEAEKANALAALQAKDPSIQTLPADQAAQIEKDTQLSEETTLQIKTAVSTKYYDEEKGIYKKFQKVKKNINGKDVEVWEPVMDQGKQVEVDLSDTYKPLAEELERISKLTTDGTENGPLSPQAQEAQQLMRTFKLHPQNEKKLLMYTSEQIQNAELNRQSENAVNIAVDYIHEDLYNFISKNDLFTKDGNGHINGLKPEAYKILEKLPDHQRVARLVILSGHYYELKGNEAMNNQRHNVAALLYKELTTMDPNQVPDALKPQINQLKEKGNNEFLESKYQEIVDEFKKGWIGNPNFPIDEKHLTRDLFLAYFCESSKVKLVRNSDNQLELPENVKKVFDQWEEKSPTELLFIEQLVNKGYIGSFLNEQFGLNLDSVTKNMDKYIGHVVGKASERKGDETNSWLPNFLKAIMDKENLKLLLKEFHLPEGAGMGLLAFFVILPSITGLASSGLAAPTDNSRE